MLIGAESGIHNEREAAEEKILSEPERDLTIATRALLSLNGKETGFGK